ncbi:protein NDR1-like [Diospyros lotus]|uniref:protein NDR1-like n=1 Tax=Diospyros lotus TaxID=55363 RepID=UPI0022557E73|nr:protein NDR1-like [Diospyros lotus]
MQSNEIPVHSEDERELKRNHTARYYAHRVRESLTRRVVKLICTIFLTFLFIIGLLVFILWLSLRPHRPRIHIRDFSMPGLAQANGFENAQVSFNVTARNSNQNMGIYYDAMEVTLYYQDQNIGGALIVGSFYEEPKNSTALTGILSGGATLTVNNQRWMQFQADRSRGEVIFRLQLTSTIRFKVVSWTSKRHKMHASCAAGVGPDGLILASYRDKKCPVYFI